MLPTSVTKLSFLITIFTKDAPSTVSFSPLSQTHPYAARMSKHYEEPARFPSPPPSYTPSNHHQTGESSSSSAWYWQDEKRAQPQTQALLQSHSTGASSSTNANTNNPYYSAPAPLLPTHHTDNTVASTSTSAQINPQHTSSSTSTNPIEQFQLVPEPHDPSHPHYAPPNPLPPALPLPLRQRITIPTRLRKSRLIPWTLCIIFFLSTIIVSVRLATHKHAPAPMPSPPIVTVINSLPWETPKATQGPSTEADPVPKETRGPDREENDDDKLRFVPGQTPKHILAGGGGGGDAIETGMAETLVGES